MIGKSEIQVEGSQDASNFEVEFKLIIVGDGGIGKTTFVKRYPATKVQRVKVGSGEVEVSSIDLPTSYGIIRFNIWDTLKSDNAEMLSEDFYKDADCAIMMFDVCSRYSYKAIPNWFKQIKKYSEDIPIVLVGNKIDDTASIKVQPRMVTFHRKRNINYFDVSALANFQWDQVILNLVKKLCDDTSVSFTKTISLQKPERELSESRIKEILDQRRECDAFVFSDDDDFK